MVGWLHERLAIVATVDPRDANNTDESSDVIDMSKYHQIMIVVLLGVLNDSATDAVTVTEDSDAAMGSEAAISGKAVNVVGTDDAKQFVIGLRADEMSAGKRYVRVKNNNSAHSQLTAIVVLGEPRFAPATDDDLSSVQTPVT